MSELPRVLESFSEGTNYHGVVQGFFPQFLEGHQWRSAAVWSHPDTGPRWMISEFGRVDPPVCWRYQ